MQKGSFKIKTGRAEKVRIKKKACYKGCNNNGRGIKKVEKTHRAQVFVFGTEGQVRL